MSEKRGARAGDQVPVSAHPAFPVIVALWFAALLGLGSLVLPPLLIEKIVVASGLGAMVEAAQPPLGVTARIVTALAAAVIGAAAGLLIARRVTAANAPRPVSHRTATLQRSAAVDRVPAKRPISAHEELGQEGLEAEPVEAARAPLAGRRRALAVTEEDARSEFLDFAPLPGQTVTPPAEPLDLDAFAEPEEELEPDSEVAAAVAPEPATRDPHARFGTASLSERRPFAPASESAMPMPVSMPFEPAVREQSQVGETCAETGPVSPPAGQEIAIVELVERFALALERRQAKAQTPAYQPEEEPAPLILPRLGSAAPVHPVAPSIPEIPAALRPVDFGDEDGDDEFGAHPLHGLDLSTALRSQDRPFDAPAPVATGADEPEAEEPEDIAEDSYPSLLAMKAPLGPAREPVRIDDPEAADEPVEAVVVFPGQSGRHATPAADGPSRDVAPRPFDRPDVAALDDHPAPTPPFTPVRTANAGETERALREALEKLQRLSGAA